MNVREARLWSDVQAEYADMPGAAGVQARREQYAPFFLRMGKDVMIEEGCRFYHPDRIVLEDDARINLGALIYGSGGLWIGRHARIGPRFFVHSANHDVEDGPMAFFERGYDYFPTVIGDNVLISANVSMMPGAILGNSTFVAAGAVVTAGRYEQRTRLFGVPAARKALSSACDRAKAPDIAFLIRDEGEQKDAVVHLLSALGLPQVAVYTYGEPLPASLHTVILNSSVGQVPPVPSNVDIWRLADDGSTVKEGNAWFDAPSGARITLPKVIAMSVVPDGRAGEDPWVRALEQTLFWLTIRLAKGAGPVTAEEAGEWDATFEVLGIEPGRKDRLLERINELIEKRRPQTRSSKRSDLVLAAARSGQCNEDLAKHVADFAFAARTGVDLIASGVAAALLNDNAVTDQVRSLLDTADFQVPGVAMPRSAAHGKGFCYSPLVLAWLFLEARRENPGFQVPEGIGVPRRLETSLEWRQAAPGVLVDEESRIISRSLIENWLKLHEAPCPAGSQVVLEDFNYFQETAPLERAWCEIFLFLQGRRGRPLVRLRPWPEGKKSAISLRYDVDRPVSSCKIADIVRGQSKVAKGPCGSWYFFTGRADNAVNARQLGQFWQEIAIHAEDPQSDPVTGLGVTHHSAPTSMYWRGDRTNEALDERGAEYCEFFTAQTGYPRPGWIRGADGAGRLATSWTTPIHFPLEGSTSDTDLDYFDQRLDCFRHLMATGGHCIIGTHPDLDQSLMEKLLTRENVDDVWFATVGNVVKRCQQVMTYGAITCTSHPSGGIALLSNESLADVQVELLFFGSREVRSRSLQLEGGRPRELESEAR